jgi:hypothetical protein
MEPKTLLFMTVALYTGLKYMYYTINGENEQ